jgi:hypothetical protein
MGREGGIHIESRQVLSRPQTPSRRPQEWLDASYDAVVWQGDPPALRRLLAAGAPPSPAQARQVAVELRDVSEPLPLALPRYAGNAYVYAALVLGGVWMFSTLPLLAMFVVVLVSLGCGRWVAVDWLRLNSDLSHLFAPQINVQRNQGLPLFIYKYMRNYRGW